MKQLFLIISLVMLALTGCAKQDSDAEKAEYAAQTRTQDLETIGALNISVIMKNTQDKNLGYSVRLLCVDNTLYVTYGTSIVPHISSEDGKPIACGVPE